MEFIYAVRSCDELQQYQVFSDRIRQPLEDFLSFAEKIYAVSALPKAVVLTDEEVATKLITDIPLPGYTTSYQLANKEPANYADNGGRIINVKLPVTGDASMLEMWAVLAGVSALMLVGLLVVSKRKNARKAK